MNKMIAKSGTALATAVWTLCMALIVIVGPGADQLARADSAGRTFNGSILRIGDNERLPISRSAALSKGKSIFVELPRDLRDVVVSDPKILDAVVQTSNRVFLFGRGVGQANAFFFDSDGELILTLEVQVGYAGGELEEILNRLIPGARISVETIGKSVVLKGFVRAAVDASRAGAIAGEFVNGATQNLKSVSKTSTKTDDNGMILSRDIKQKKNGNSDKPKIINMISVNSQEQVLLKVTVAEMSRANVKRLGINWNNVNIGDSVHLGGTNNQFPITGTIGANSFLTGLFGPSGDRTNCIATIATAAALPSAAVGAAPATNCLANRLEAFERNGLVRTLAEPTLTAISGETASFLAGGEFPVPVAQDNNTITVDWKPFGVGLSFTPVVMSEGRVSMKIATEVSELTSEGSVQIGTISLPALKVRRANTTIELPSGGSLVIAGLLSEDTRQNIDGVPGLKKLPILGTLFRSRDFRKRETDLVIIVTPVMVKPVARSKLARPDDNFMPESDLRATLLGRFNQIYGRAAVAEGSIKDDIGFIVE